MGKNIRGTISERDIRNSVFYFLWIFHQTLENILYDELDNKKIWNDIYKPYHKMDAAKCSKCFRFIKIENIYFKIKYLLKIYFIKTIILKVVLVI